MPVKSLVKKKTLDQQLCQTEVNLQFWLMCVKVRRSWEQIAPAFPPIHNMPFNIMIDETTGSLYDSGVEGCLLFGDKFPWLSSSESLTKICLSVLVGCMLCCSSPNDCGGGFCRDGGLSPPALRASHNLNFPFLKENLDGS